MLNGLPLVASCDVSECFYNCDCLCHAPAINIGGDHPNCDTFIVNNDHSDFTNTGMVGACHVSECKFNSELTCCAAEIVVRHHSDHADCGTFTPC